MEGRPHIYKTTERRTQRLTNAPWPESTGRVVHAVKLDKETNQGVFDVS